MNLHATRKAKAGGRTDYSLKPQIHSTCEARSRRTSTLRPATFLPLPPLPRSVDILPALFVVIDNDERSSNIRSTRTTLFTERSRDNRERERERHVFHRFAMLSRLLPPSHLMHQLSSAARAIIARATVPIYVCTDK